MKYSLVDVIAARFPQNSLRFTMAISTFIISIFYMIPQLVASGLLIRLLLDIDYSTSVLVIGSLMTIYVVFGGMMATSWVHIFKTFFLLRVTILLSLNVFYYIHFCFIIHVFWFFDSCCFIRDLDDILSFFWWYDGYFMGSNY